MKKLDIFIKRLKKIGIITTYFANYPWIYIDTVNGKIVKERFESDHGWVVGYAPIKVGQEFEFTDISKIFKLIRSYK